MCQVMCLNHKLTGSRYEHIMQKKGAGLGIVVPFTSHVRKAVFTITRARDAGLNKGSLIL
jgi:hypothetical protein